MRLVRSKGNRGEDDECQGNHYLADRWRCCRLACWHGVVKGGGYGLIGNIIVGIVGGLIAGWLLPHIGVVIAGGVIGSIINAFIGAVILLVILRLIKV